MRDLVLAFIGSGFDLLPRIMNMEFDRKIFDFSPA